MNVGETQANRVSSETIDPGSVATAEPQFMPNILLLVAEDLSPRIGSFGDPVAHTPNIDELASNGTRYTHTFTTAGVCAPSRAALLMGQHQISFGAQHMRTSTAPLGAYLAQPALQARAFPERLREAGYYTFTDRKLDYQFSGIRAGTGPFSIWDRDGVNLLNADVAPPWAALSRDQPFFGLINFMQTHESGVMRATGKPHSAVHAGTQQFRKQYGLVAKQITDPAAVFLPPYYPDLPAVRSDLARHYDNIRAMDAQVGLILAALRRDGLADRTIVIWTADHGDGLPRAKRELYDSGIRVPMIVFVPAALRKLRPDLAASLSANVSDDLVSFVDIAPTVLALAGLDASTYWHGQNFLKPTQPKRHYVYASRDRIDEQIDRQRAVRSQRYKLIRSYYPNLAGGHLLEYRDILDMTRAWRAAAAAGELSPVQSRWFEPFGAEQFYDLESDPHEIDNLLDRAVLSRAELAVLQVLRAELDGFIDRTQDMGAMPETELRASFLIDGDLPQTPPPEITWDGDRAVIKSKQNVSIGYRLREETAAAEMNALSGEHSWRLYVEPVAGELIEAKAVRYGWRESVVVRARRPQ